DIKRVQSEEETREIIDAARANGMGSLNIDLIYGLPHQTMKGFKKTIDTVLDIRPERVALFHYAHVPWIKKHQTAMTLDAIQSSEDKLTTFCRAIEQFRDAGYNYIGLDHFALPDDELSVAQNRGDLGRNFMGYTTRAGADMLSLGVSSIGEVGGAFVQNSPNDREYQDFISERRFATIRGHHSSDEDQLRRRVILGLMCNGVFKKADAQTDFGIKFDEHFALELRELAPLAADGLVELKPQEVRLTELGQLFMRNVAVPFDAYLRERKKRGESGSGTFSKTL
ncbi:MAG: oxygen-independent coproporphyrinogen-3 oxidase, partial [Planctomycetota bacterium]